MGDLLRRRAMMLGTSEPPPTPAQPEYATADETVGITTSMMLPANCVILYELWFVPQDNGQWTSVGHWNGFLGFEKRNGNAYVFNRNATGTRSYCNVTWTAGAGEVWTALEASVASDRKVTIARYNAAGEKKTGNTSSAAATPSSPFTVYFLPGNYVKRISLVDNATGNYVNDIRVTTHNGVVCLHDIITDEYFYEANNSIYLANPPS